MPGFEFGGTALPDNLTRKLKAVELCIDKSTTDTSQELNKYLINLSMDYPEPRYSLFRSGIGTIPRGDLQAVKAKSKNGKSFVCSILIASLLGCGDFGFLSDNKQADVTLFDTEQNERNTAKLCRRIHALLGWSIKENHPGFRAYHLRTLSPEERLGFIQDTISRDRPTNVFIDGVADLIENFNDIGQSNDVINILMRLSSDYDCSITCVLHTNKSRDDNGMKGHLGTILLQKASDVFEVVKSGSIFNVTETDCRNQPVADFSFVLDTNSIPRPTECTAESEEQEKTEKLKGMLRLCFGGRMLTYKELTEAYQLQAAISMPTAKRRVAEAKTKGFIQVSNGRYRLSLKEA